MSFARIWSDLASGQLDMSLTGIRSPERGKTLWCAESVTSKNFIVIGGAARKAEVRSGDGFMADSKLVFGVVRGYTHGKQQDTWLQKNRQTGWVEESANTDILFEKLKEGRIDGMFSFPFVNRKLIKELGLKEQVAVLAGVDRNAALIRMSGDHRLYNCLLDMFVESYTDAAGTVMSLLQRHDYATDERLAHSLKGDAGTVGAT